MLLKQVWLKKKLPEFSSQCFRQKDETDGLIISAFANVPLGHPESKII